MEIFKNIHLLEFFSCFISLAVTFLGIKQKYTRWPLDIFVLLINLYINHKIHLYDKWISTLVILILDLYGWYNWKYAGSNKQGLQVSKSNIYHLIAIIFFGSINSILISFFLKKINSFLPLIGGFRTTFYLIAIWLASRKKIENWILWIILDFISIFIYYHKGLYFFSIKYFIYTILACIGYLSWHRFIKNSQHRT